mmetsp:Transcript_790/g.1732  ORF Transcript_790/g.1732 Transcript_790/m.1732 type:complete len:224 (-) Transcript_790:1009-1680(-)
MILKFLPSFTNTALSLSVISVPFNSILASSCLSSSTMWDPFLRKGFIADWLENTCMVLPLLEAAFRVAHSLVLHARRFRPDCTILSAPSSSESLPNREKASNLRLRVARTQVMLEPSGGSSRPPSKHAANSALVLKSRRTLPIRPIVSTFASAMPMATESTRGLLNIFSSTTTCVARKSLSSGALPLMFICTPRPPRRMSPIGSSGRTRTRERKALLRISSPT